jgi:hypothetical protein
MARASGMFFLFVTAGLVAAAQQGSPYEQTLKQAIDNFDKIGVTLKTIMDEETAAAAKPDLKKAATAFLEARAKAAKLQPPEKDEKARLEKEFKAKLEESMRKVFTEVRRVEAIPGGRDALKEISAVLKKESKEKDKGRKDDK